MTLVLYIYSDGLLLSNKLIFRVITRVVYKSAVIFETDFLLCKNRDYKLKSNEPPALQTNPVTIQIRPNRDGVIMIRLNS